MKGRNHAFLPVREVEASGVENGGVMRAVLAIDAPSLRNTFLALQSFSLFPFEKGGCIFCPIHSI